VLSPTLSLLGYSLHDEELQPGSPVTVDLVWHGTHAEESAAPSGMAVALAAAGDGGESLLWEGTIAPDAKWPADHIYCQRVRTTIPDTLSSGDYNLALGWQQQGQEQRATLDVLTLGPSTRSFEPPPLIRSVDALLADEQGGQFRLMGLAELDQVAGERGDSLAVTLVWREEARADGNYKAFVHLVDDDGVIVAQSDVIPAQGYATNRWAPGEVIVDRHLLELPDELPPGDYQLLAGLYEPIGVRRLAAQNANGEALPDDQVPLGAVELPLTGD
jgi:hypothetical protein